MFRYNNRKGKTDAARFTKLLSQVAGKRLTYAEVTGKVGGAEAFQEEAGTREEEVLDFFSLFSIKFDFDLRVRHRYKLPHKIRELSEVHPVRPWRERLGDAL